MPHERIAWKGSGIVIPVFVDRLYNALGYSKLLQDGLPAVASGEQQDLG